MYRELRYGRPVPIRAEREFPKAESAQAKAIRLNRCMSEWLGWGKYRQDINRLLGFTRTSPTEKAFVSALRKWQHRHGLANDGILGLTTLNTLHDRLGIPQLKAAPERPGWITWHASPNHRSRDGAVIDRIILHATGGDELRSAINTFRSPDRTSAHYLIDRAGDVIQMVELDRAAQHAGASQNKRSVGIEIVNRNALRNGGSAVRMCVAQSGSSRRWKCDRWQDVTPLHAFGDYYRPSGRREYWVPYSEEQYRSLIRLTRFLTSCIPTIGFITGHEHLVKWQRTTTKSGRSFFAKNRNDPGGRFDWGRLKRALEGQFTGTLCHEHGRFDTAGRLASEWRTGCPGF